LFSNDPKGLRLSERALEDDTSPVSKRLILERIFRLCKLGCKKTERVVHVVSSTQHETVSNNNISQRHIHFPLPTDNKTRDGGFRTTQTQTTLTNQGDSRVAPAHTRCTRTVLLHTDLDFELPLQVVFAEIEQHLPVDTHRLERVRVLVELDIVAKPAPDVPDFPAQHALSTGRGRGRGRGRGVATAAVTIAVTVACTVTIAFTIAITMAIGG
jgi:hypothetical protein